MQIIKAKIRDIIGAEIISTREAASILKSHIERNMHNNLSIDTINIDFEGVSFISRSFADEISNVVRKNLETNNKKVNFVNMTENVHKMINLVRKKKSNKLDIMDSIKSEVNPVKILNLV